eukprot:13140277-Alexandrium_andersonii.AAC.1
MHGQCFFEFGQLLRGRCAPMSRKGVVAQFGPIGQRRVPPGGVICCGLPAAASDGGSLFCGRLLG